MSESMKENIMKPTFQRILEELLLEKDLEDITTTEIVERSGLSRSTFYRCFKDKYELANWSFHMLLDQLDKEISSTDKAEKMHVEIVRYIGENRIIFKKLMNYDKQNSFRDYYINSTFASAKRSDKNKNYKEYMKEHYMILYHANGILEVLADWLRADNPLSHEEISRIIDENRNEAFMKLYKHMQTQNKDVVSDRHT